MLVGHLTIEQIIYQSIARSLHFYTDQYVMVFQGRSFVLATRDTT
jgi:hypothetical protein